MIAIPFFCLSALFCWKMVGVLWKYKYVKTAQVLHILIQPFIAFSFLEASALLLNQLRILNMNIIFLQTVAVVGMCILFGLGIFTVRACILQRKQMGMGMFGDLNKELAYASLTVLSLNVIILLCTIRYPTSNYVIFTSHKIYLNILKK